MTLQSKFRQLGFAPIILGALAEGGRLQQVGGQLKVPDLVKER